MSWSEIPTQLITPEQLKVGDTILYKGQHAEVTKIWTWHDTFHGMVYGVDFIVKGKQGRTSFVHTSQVEVLT